jgi:hemoglobin/transferrin/lactoferrin receptor protein
MLAAGMIAQPAPAQDAVALEPVQIVGIAHRAGRPLDDAPATVSVIGRDDIEKNLSFTLRDLFRYEPGVSIDNAPARFGLGNISIRGLDGNRVQMTLDGIRLPDGYRVGSFSNASRNQLDLELLQRVEIMRGPGSALYGSDALAGVVAFSTIEPRDVLRHGPAAGVVADLGYADANQSWQRGAVAAAEFGTVQGLIAYQRADGHETANRGNVDVIGTARTASNPQETDRESWLGKVVVPVRGGRLRLTADRYAQGIVTDVLSLNPQSSRTVSLAADDASLRERVSIDADLADAAPQLRLRVLAYTQRSVTRDDTSEVRANTTAVCLSAPGTVRCERDVQFRFAQREDGASMIGEVDHLGRWVIGVEAARTHTDEQRNGAQTNLNTGAVTAIVGGEPLPTRDFPRSVTDRIGLFAQDEIELAQRRLTLIPALRYDRFRIAPQSDSIFATTNPGRSVTGLDDAAFSPKLGALLRVADGMTLSAQWASGFRAPPAADINIGLSNLPAGYTVIPNPGLKPEHSRGLEFGMRSRFTNIEFTATAFDTRYTDLIVSRAPLPCPADPRCVAGATGTFQSQNIARARIRGVEATALARLGAGWSVQAAAAQASGTDTAQNRPLNSVEPARATVGLLFDRGTVSAAVHVTHGFAKTRIDTSAGALFAPPAYTAVDLTASFQLTKHVRLSLGVFNLFDQKYWLWSDLKSVLNPGVTIDRYTQPGRNASALLRANW